MAMSFDLDGIETLQWGFFLLVMIGEIAILARRHAHEISIIWYINTLFFVFFVCIGYAAKTSKTQLTGLCGSYEEACKHIYAMVTNLGDEINLLLFGLALAVVPQLMSYAFCILSGSASTPRYVSLVGTIAFWGLVKFVAGLGGILSAGPFAIWFAEGKPVGVSNVVGGFSYVFMAFTFAAAYVLLTETFPEFIKARSGRLGETVGRHLLKIHKFATRHVPEEPPSPPHSLARRALTYAVTTDVIYNFVVEPPPTPTTTQPSRSPPSE
jgi:hypothetical protein